MKRIGWALIVFILAPWGFAGVASAVEMGPAAGAMELVDKDNLEGWIVGIDYKGNRFQMLDPRGFQRRVVAKPGMIGDYRIGDKVRVEIDSDYKRARTIEKLY